MAKSGRTRIARGVDGRDRCFPLEPGAEREFARSVGILGYNSNVEEMTGERSCDMRGPRGRRCKITGQECPVSISVNNG